MVSSFPTKEPNQLNGERIFFSTVGAETIGYVHEKTWAPYFTLCPQINQKWIIDSKQELKLENS